MAGVKGRSGPPGNQNNFKHGLSVIQKRREAGVITEAEDGIRTEILAGLIQGKGGEPQISTAMRVLAEIIASDVSLLVSFNRAIDAVIKNNQKVVAKSVKESSLLCKNPMRRTLECHYSYPSTAPYAYKKYSAFIDRRTSAVFSVSNSYRRDSDRH